MTRLPKSLAALAFLLSATPVLAVDLFDTAGAWTGEGRLAPGAEAPLERGRCKVNVKPDAGGKDVSITGTCVVAGGSSEISLRLVRQGGGKIGAGVWSAATDQVVQLTGRESADGIDLASTTALMVEGKPYQTKVDVETSGASGFSIRQIMRAEGAEAWRLVVDMTYRAAGG